MIYTIKAQSPGGRIDYYQNNIHGKRQITDLKKAKMTILEITKTEYGSSGPIKTIIPHESD